MQKLVLLGYMGCGKSTIGRALSKKTNYPFIDLDKKIESKENLSITNIFKEKGEVYFRKIEHKTLVELLQSKNNLIIGLGGGTPCYDNNAELLNAEGVVSVYLEGSVDTLFNRLSRNKSKRPLIADKTNEELQEFVAKHLFERRIYYMKAKHRIIINHLSVYDTVKAVLRILKKSFPAKDSLG